MTKKTPPELAKELGIDPVLPLAITSAISG
jgi:hypothetical protein